MVKKLYQPTEARWFLHHAKHHKQAEQRVFKAWMSIEARAAVKHRHNDIAKKKVKIQILT